MKRVGVRAFRDHATKYLAGDEALAIERNGQTIGFYIPAGSKRPEPSAAVFAHLETTIAQVLAQTGFSREELVRFLDPSQPEPGGQAAPEDEVSVTARAPRR